MNPLAYLNETIVPFTEWGTFLNLYLNVSVIWIGVLASIWLLATNVFEENTPSTKLLFSVSLADILLLGTCAVTSTQNAIAGGFALGEIGCYISYFFIVGPACISICTLGLVAWERYQIICRGKQMSDREIYCWIVGCWIVCCGNTVIPFLTNNPQSIQLDPNLICCAVKWSDRSTPSIILTVLLILIVAISFSTAAYSYYNVYVTYKTVVGRKKAKQDNQNLILEKCIVLTLSLLLFWTPYYIKIVYEIISGQSGGSTWGTVANISALICSFTNPFILCKYDNRVRGNMLAPLRLLRKRERSLSTSGRGTTDGGKLPILPAVRSPMESVIESIQPTARM
jgi:uncharacterized membrane protein YidH (DUF202 family)